MPFAPFGIATVSRQNDPQLPEFLYALSASQGADPTRDDRHRRDRRRPATASPTASSAWSRRRTTASGSSRPAARPTRRPATSRAAGATCCARADFNDGTLQALRGRQRRLDGHRRRAAGRGRVARQGRGRRLLRRRVPADLLRDHRRDLDRRSRPAAGRRNAYVIFDYWSPTDFKFAGIDDSTNKIVIGHRDASGWHFDAQGSVTGSRQGRHATTTCSSTVNGTTVTVDHRQRRRSHLHVRAAGARRRRPGRAQQGPRRVRLQQLARRLRQRRGPGAAAGPSRSTRTEYFEDGTAEQFTGPRAAPGASSDGRYVGTAAMPSAYASDDASTSGRRLDPATTVEVETRRCSTTRRRRHRLRRLRHERLQVRRARRRRPARRSSATSTRSAAGSSRRPSPRRSPPAPTTTLDVVAQGHGRDGLAERQRARQLRVQRGRRRRQGRRLVTSGATTSVDRFEIKTNDQRSSPARRRRPRSASATAP